MKQAVFITGFNNWGKTLIIQELFERHLFSALCPSMETNNNFVNLLSNPPFSSYQKLHIFLIEFKWEHHAKLIIDNIKKEGSQISNANFITIDADRNHTPDKARFDAKFAQIMQELANIFP